MPSARQPERGETVFQAAFRDWGIGVKNQCGRFCCGADVVSIYAMWCVWSAKSAGLRRLMLAVRVLGAVKADWEKGGMGFPFKAA